MAYGFISYNDSGFLQISEDYINLRIVASGTAVHSGYSTCTTSDNWVRKGVQVTFPSITAPMILIQAKSDCYISVTHITSNTFVFTLTDTFGPVNGTISYKILGQGNTLSSDTYGLRFWGTQGQIIYDSGAAYAKAAEVLSCPLIFSNQVGGFYVAPSSTSISCLTYPTSPWIFFNNIGPIYMANIDFWNQVHANQVLGIGFKYSTGLFTLGALINNEGYTYKIASGGERIGDSSIVPANYTYYNKFIVGDLA